jgi:hypothetical protein
MCRTSEALAVPSYGGHMSEQVHIRFCFRETATADAFRNRFGGECLTYRG